MSWRTRPSAIAWLKLSRSSSLRRLPRPAHGQLPVDRQGNADAASDAAADEAARRVGLVKLEGRRRSHRRRPPSVDRIVEQPDAAHTHGTSRCDQPDPSCWPGRAGSGRTPTGAAAARTRPRRGENHELRFLLAARRPRPRRRRLDLPYVARQLAHIGVGTQIEPAGLQRLGNEDIQSARPRAGRVAVLLGEPADDGRSASVVGAHSAACGVGKVFRRARHPL